MLECVINISEGKDLAKLGAMATVLGHDFLDLHSDGDHNRSVFTLYGTQAARMLVRNAIATFDIRHHSGLHPRYGVVDVVPFVALEPSTFDDAIKARDEFAQFAATELGVPCFLYGPERTLPYIRAHAFKDLLPDLGPQLPHPTAGSICVGARPLLVAYNLWLKDAPLDVAKKIAASIRSESVRALGMQVGRYTQVSMNLIAPHSVGPPDVYDEVAKHAEIERAELVGLIPSRVLATIARSRWAQLDVGSERTIEWRIAARNRAAQSLK